jgi:hypothetical protein
MDEIKNSTGFDWWSVPAVPPENTTKSLAEILTGIPPIESKIVESITRTSFIFEIKDIMKEHALTLDQAVYLLASMEGIDWELTGADALSLVNKGLIREGKVNQTLLFRTRPAIQGTLELNFESVPRGTEETLAVAHNLEDKLVPAMHLTEEFKKSIADEYFKGDLNVARYFIIFRHLFPVRDIKANAACNKHFGFSYNGITLWDSHIRVAKKFHEIYRKKDIGLFLMGAYYCVRDSIDIDHERCFMTKPYKFLLAFEPWYESAKERLEERKKEADRVASLQAENDSNKPQSL